MPPKKTKVAAQNREQRKRDKRAWEETRLRTISEFQHAELMYTSLSVAGGFDDQQSEHANPARSLPEMAAGPLAASREDIEQRLQASRESLAMFLRAQKSQAELLAIDRHEQLFERFDLSESLRWGETECECLCACDFGDQELVVGWALFGDLTHPCNFRKRRRCSYIRDVNI